MASPPSSDRIVCPCCGRQYTITTGNSIPRFKCVKCGTEISISPHQGPSSTKAEATAEASSPANRSISKYDWRGGCIGLVIVGWIMLWVGTKVVGFRNNEFREAMGQRAIDNEPITLWLMIIACLLTAQIYFRIFGPGDR